MHSVNRTRVGVIGADPTGRGFAARAHIPAILASPRLELAAVCTNHPASAREAAVKWGVARSYSNYTDLVANPEIDLITIAVRVRLHREIVEAAVRAGKSVYCEWPLGLDVAEAELMAALAREHGVSVGVGNQSRHSSAVQKARRLLKSGELGRILSFQLTVALASFAVRSDRWWLAREEEASGALQVSAAHALDLVRDLLGDVQAVSGVRLTQAPQGTYADTGEPFEWTAADNVVVTARLVDGGVGGVMISNTATIATGFRLDIFCASGQLELTAPSYVSFSPVRVRLARPGQGELADFAVDVETAPPGSDGWAAINVLHALEALHEATRGGPAFTPNFEDAVALHRLIAAIGRASDTAQWVKP